MIILYCPFISSLNAQNCSVSNRMKKTIAYMLKIHDDVSFIIPFPKNLTPPDEYRHERVTILEAPEVYAKDYYQYFRAFALESWFIENFNQLIGKYYFDAVLNDEPRIGNTLNMAISKVRDKTDKYIPIYNLYEFATVMGSPSFVKNVALGSVGTIPLFDSKVQERKLFKLFRNVLSSSEVLQLKANTAPFYMGSIDLESISKVKNETPVPNRPFTIHYANRLASHYEAREIIKLIDYFYARGNNIKLVLTIPQPNLGRYGSAVMKHLKTRGVPHELHLGLGQEDYWKVACNADCFLFTIKRLEFMAGAMEQIMCGQIGIFANTEYIDHILPYYPHKVDKAHERFAIIEDIMQRTQDYQDGMEVTRQFIRETYDNKVFAENLYQDCRKRIVNNGYVIPKSVNSILAGFNLTEFTYEQLKDYVKANSATKVNIDDAGWGMVNKFEYINLLKNQGYDFNVVNGVLKGGKYEKEN